MTSYKIVKAAAPHTDWEMWFENKQGDCFHIEWGKMWNYQLHINLSTMAADNESIDCPTLNDFCETKDWTAHYCYDEITLDYSDKYPQCDSVKNMNDIDVDSIVKEAKEKGINLSRSALAYCVSAWMCDLKSGFRDEENGVHIFIPCGCNPLIIHITTLNSLCEDWQITYKS